VVALKMGPENMLADAIRDIEVSLRRDHGERPALVVPSTAISEAA
jgi:hypothetical protein